jgi:hypothetical protein
MLFRFALAMIAISVLVSALTVRFMIGRNRGPDITVRSITVVDRENQMIARLGSEQDAAAFTLYDKQHRKRAALFVEEVSGAPDLYFYDAAGTARAALNLYDSGVGNLDYANGIDSPYVITKYTPQGNFQVTLEEIKDKKPHILGMLDFSVIDHKPRLSVIDEDRRTDWQTP